MVGLMRKWLRQVNLNERTVRERFMNIEIMKSWCVYFNAWSVVGKADLEFTLVLGIMMRP